MAKFACALVVKNAGHKFAEWIAYQIALGFDRIFILDNGSTDDTKAIAESFARLYDVQILDWPITTDRYQLLGYDHMIRACAGTFDWIACIDCDEFIVLPEGRTLKDLLDVPSDVYGIAMPWAFFGSNGHHSPPDDLVIKSFLTRAEPGFDPNRQIKSIIRPEAFVTCRSVHFFDLPGDYMDMAHNRMRINHHALRSAPDYAGGKLHHYFVQSQEDWMRKISRGYHDTTRLVSDFTNYDRNEVYDDSALRYVPRVTEILRTVTIPSAS